MSEISVRSGETVINRWQSYSIDVDMLAPADGFQLALAPATKEIYDLVAPDSIIEVRVDDNVLVTGHVDERSMQIARGGTSISINGRDKAGRMVDESADLTTFGTEDIQTLALALGAPQFSAVTISNARNRRLVRGRRAGLAPTIALPDGIVGPEERAVGPVTPDTIIPGVFPPAKAPKKVEPGETRWGVLQQFLEPARLLAWSSGDGQEIVISLPNYNQKPQYRFFVPKSDSSKKAEGNVMTATLTTSVANRFSEIRVTGSGKGDSKNYGPRVTKHTATVVQASLFDGFHLFTDFTERKRLIMSDPDVKSEEDALERATREVKLRDAERVVLELEVQGHNQRRLTSEGPALFAFDTMAEVVIEEIGLEGLFMIVAVNFTVSKDGGELTRLRLVPTGTELTS